MRALILGLLPVIGAAVILSVVSCATPEYTYGRCSETDDCFTDINQQPGGSICISTDIEGVCTCPIGTMACCADGEPGRCLTACAPEHLCDIPPECEVDAECPQPPSPECGRGFCVDGRCEMEMHSGPLASQRYGDCKIRRCDGGTLIEDYDPNDIYDDVNDCTFDMCIDGASVNTPLANGITCPVLGTGYCYEASCVECIASMPAAASCGAGLQCDGFWCEPFPQCSGECGGLCAPCATGHPCKVNSDCLSGNCVSGMCQLPSCSNGKKDGEETDIDCGSCGPCANGKLCKAPGDCSSGVCKGGKCQAPTCVDGTKNGDESGVDCGGACGPC